MPIPATGPIKDDDISSTFPGATGPFKLSNYYRGGPLVPDIPGNAAIPKSGPIKFSDFRGGSNTTKGHYEQRTAGVYYFTVPPYTTMTINLGGAGSGGGSSVFDGGSYCGAGNNSGPGGASGADGTGFSLRAYGGTAALGGYGGKHPSDCRPGASGTPGTATGGDTNTPGGGSPGGPGSVYVPSNDARGKGGDGAAGGLCVKAFNLASGGPPIGSQIGITVGAAGVAGPYPGSPGKPGTDGFITIDWS